MLHSWDNEDIHNLIASGNQKPEPANGSVELPEESCSADLVYHHKTPLKKGRKKGE